MYGSGIYAANKTSPELFHHKTSSPLFLRIKTAKSTQAIIRQTLICTNWTYTISSRYLIIAFIVHSRWVNLNLQPETIVREQPVHCHYMKTAQQALNLKSWTTDLPCLKNYHQVALWVLYKASQTDKRRTSWKQLLQVSVLTCISVTHVMLVFWPSVVGEIDPKFQPPNSFSAFI